MISFSCRTANRRFRAALIFWAAVTLLCPFRAAGDKLKAVVVLDVTSSFAESAFSVLSGHIADLAVDLVAERVTSVSTDLQERNTYFGNTSASLQADVVFFWDFSDPGRVALYVAMPKLGTTLIRNIDAVDETIASRFEITAVVIRGILTAMLSGGEIGVHVSHALDAPGSAENRACSPTESKTGSKPAEAPLTRPEDRQRPVFGVQASYGIAWVSGELLPVHHFQPALRISIRSADLFVAYRGTMPITKETEVLALALTPHAAVLGFALSLHRKNFVFKLGAAVLLDAMSVESISKIDAVGKTSDSTDFRAIAQPSVTVEWYPLSSAAYFVFSVSPDFYIFQNAFYIQDDQGEKIPFLRLWPVSPFVRIGIGFNLQIH